MMRSYFVLTAGANTPARFTWDANRTSALLSINEIWDVVNTLSGNLLLMRVRSELSAGADMGATDQIESVVGLIDATTRWRIAATGVRIAIQSIRTASLAQQCFAVLAAMISKHQASFTVQEKQGLASVIQGEIVKLKDDDSRQAIYETEVAQMLLRFVFADNEHEATGMLPYVPIYMLNCMAGDEKGTARLLTLGTLYSSMLLGEAFNRLNERLPEWLYAPMPTTMRGVVEAPARVVLASPAVDDSARAAATSVHDNNDEE